MIFVVNILECINNLALYLPPTGLEYGHFREVTGVGVSEHVVYFIVCRRGLDYFYLTFCGCVGFVSVGRLGFLVGFHAEDELSGEGV